MSEQDKQAAQASEKDREEGSVNAADLVDLEVLDDGPVGGASSILKGVTRLEYP